MKIKYTYLLISMLFLGSFVQAQDVDHNGESYTVKKGKVFKDGEDITASLNAADRESILTKWDHAMAMETAKRDAEKLEKKREKAERDSRKAEKKQKKAERALKKKQKAQDAHKKAEKRLKKEQRKYDKLKRKGKLSPNEEEKMLRKLEDLRDDVKKTKRRAKRN